MRRAQRRRRVFAVSALLAVDDFDVEVEAAVERDVRGLRLRSQRGGKHARDGDSDGHVRELFALVAANFAWV